MADWLETTPDFNDERRWIKLETLYCILERIEGRVPFLNAVNGRDLNEMNFIGLVGIVVRYCNPRNQNLRGLDMFFFCSKFPQLRIWFNESEFRNNIEKAGAAFYYPRSGWVSKLAGEKFECSCSRNGAENLTIRFFFTSFKDPKDIRCALRLEGKFL